MYRVRRLMERADMKRTFTSLMLGVALFVGSAGVGLAQDFDAGVAALNRGDYATAFREFSALVERGNSSAQYNLGIMFAEGLGITQDYRQAGKWFRLSAERGNWYAQFSLGQLYREGRGVPQDYREALRWYRSSSENGYADAQNNLGVMYVEGQGVTQDYVHAHMWFNIAHSNGLEAAKKNRDNVARSMTAAQIASAQELAKQCLAKNYKGC